MTYSLEDAIRAIRAAWEHNGGNLTVGIYRKSKARPSLSYMHRYFGGYSAVVRMAGLVPHWNRTIEELMPLFRENFNALTEILGRTPTANDYAASGLDPSYDLFRQRDISWETLLQLAELEKRPNIIPEKQTIERPCFICGNSMHVISNHGGLKTKMYCSLPCKNEGRKRKYQSKRIQKN